MDTISEKIPRSKIVLKMMLRVVFEKVSILKEKYFETSKKKNYVLFYVSLKTF